MNLVSHARMKSEFGNIFLDLYRTRYSMHPTSDPHALFEACYEKQNPSSDVPDVEPTSLKVEDENGQKLAATSEE
eukprot:m.165473 g.165473  ORF g.165473 m.165473 type:complete len:75 (+) comp38890_c2_seq88:15-239(+)